MAFYGVFMWPFFMVLVYGRCKAQERNGEAERKLKGEKDGRERRGRKREEKKKKWRRNQKRRNINREIEVERFQTI